jgi:transmembrane sensor
MIKQDPSHLSDEATTWLARMDAGTWSDADEQALQAWLAEDPRRRGALLQAEAAWLTLDPPSATAIEPSIRRLRFSRRSALAIGGASIAASLTAGLLWFRSASYTTEVGEIRRVPLADGSVAAINTASRIEVAMAEARREVRLDRGEAWFQVAKDPKRPFLVEAGRVRVQAVGTAFSVRRRDDGADILVSEGVVEAWADGAEGNRIRLVAGRRAFVGENAAIRQEPAEPSSVDRTLAWRAGKIDLAGNSLTEAIAEFNRHNQRKIYLADPALGHEQFDGLFRTDDPEGFAVAIKNSLQVEIDLSDSDRIRIGRPRR